MPAPTAIATSSLGPKQGALGYGQVGIQVVYLEKYHVSSNCGEGKSNDAAAWTELTRLGTAPNL